MSTPHKTELLPQYDPKKVEDKIYKLWEESGFFNPDNLPSVKNKKAKTYSIVVPPPNITGSLHMGHALNATIQDILIRKKRMEGYKTMWLPGTDHASIATQYVIEKELKKEGLSRYDLGREKFLERAWAWKEKYGHIILDQFKKLGSSMDWTRSRFTMDPEYQRSVNEAFLHYYKKGCIYRGERTVNWCTRCATSLSDLELEYKEKDGKFYYIKYGSLILGTVRPETKLGDTALAVNPEDKRYKKYIGKEIEIQSVDPKIPRNEEPKLKTIKIKVIADEAADPKFGTGVIKVTPAHDLADFEIYQRHPDIPVLKVIDEKGRMNENAGVRYSDLKTAEAREQIVKDMQKLGLIEKVEPYKHNVATCYRCGTVVEPMPSKQWFLKMGGLAKKAVQAVKSGKVRFCPKRWEKIYFDWLKNIRDWPISRQLWWGHRMIVWFHDPKCVPIPGREKEIEKCEKIKISVTEPKCGHCAAKFTQSEDVLDTWFSSALWPFAVLDWPDKTKDLKEFYPTAVLSTARDIINLWVSRMIFSGLEFTGQIPFRDIIIHATILTKDGKRMSKSLGTGVDPLILVEKYGADAVRFGLIWQAMGGQDIHWAEEHVIAGRKFCNKVWNASRFIFQQIIIPNKPKAKTTEDKKIISEFEKTNKIVDKLLEKYEFGQALHELYEFFWHKFCDIYLESSKTQITDPALKKSTQEILVFVLSGSLKLLHPFMPFITEEIWSHLPIKDKKMLLVENWPK